MFKTFPTFLSRKKSFTEKKLKVSLSRNVDEKIIKMFVFLKKWKVVLITASKKGRKFLDQAAARRDEDDIDRNH